MLLAVPAWCGAGFISTPQRAEGRSWHCPGERERKAERNRGVRVKQRKTEIEKRDR